MIRIVEELDNGRVRIESDCGKLLDIGGGPVKALIVNRAEIEYVEEVGKGKK